MELQDIHTVIPSFTGFYHSIWYYGDTEYEEAYNISTELKLKQNQDDGDIVEAILEVADYEEHEKDVCLEVAGHWEYVLKKLGYLEKLEHESVWSPREYNFQTDKNLVVASFTQEQLTKAKSDFYEYRDDLHSSVKDTFTSYDGFMSFHSNDIYDEEWEEWYTDDYKYIWVLWQLALIHGYEMDDMHIWEMTDIHFSFYYSIEEVQNILMPYKESDYHCKISGNPLNEYNYFDHKTIELAEKYEHRLGKRPKVLSFETVKDEKFPWFDNLPEHEREHFLDDEQVFYEASEIFHRETQNSGELV
ncbi:hypothetical protein ACKGJO_06810 [Gracilimonas sp. Q87]|uniref:hypothetical protein n=1 Tax=Gracilimonas sp. Q87 TaxID=3384766 RepID=UPI003984610A